MNAIRAERIHQAYLFTGSRGIGKTSIARIFAKVIRCENTSIEAETTRSCDECASCREITAGTSVDVIEIDGASNNGVEAVREIRENAKYLPSTGKRKIYIIDEVHMLTTAAFNALLKTLEEPPPHVIFIFATTEPHKIPATILSRCQRFDYRRITIAQAQARLLQIAQAEQIQIEPGALALIARAAEGSMRDALSLLDQVIAFSGAQVSVQSVRESIGLIEGQTLIGIVNAVFARNALTALQHVDQAYQRGHDLRVLTRSLIEFLHAAILAKIGAQSPEGLELSEEEWKELSNSAKQRELEEIEMIFQVLHQGLEWIARSPQPKVVLDILLVKCATAEALVFLDSDEVLPAKPMAQAPAPAPSPVLTTPAAAIPVAAPVATPVPPTLSVKSNSWEGFIEHARKTRPLLASILEHGNCVLNRDTLGAVSGMIISFPPNHVHYRDQLQNRVYQEHLLSFTKEYFGTAIKAQVDLKESGESVAGKRERELKERELNSRNAAQNHPIIKEARSLFGGELGPIELTGSDSGDRDE